MSLKTFHLIFVTCSVLLCCGMGVWCFREAMQGQGWTYLAGGVGSFAAAAVLVRYGVVVWHKLKDESWM